MSGNALYRRIMRAAEELFKRNGFRGVTMEAVARDAAVSKATLYSHFSNKDDLFRGVCSRMADLLSRAFAEALELPQQTLDERILAAMLAKHRLTYTLVRSSPHAEELFSHKAQLAGELFARADRVMLQQLTEALGQDSLLRPSAQRLARALMYGTAELAARSSSVDALEADLTAFVAVHLAGARALAPGVDLGPHQHKAVAREFFTRFSAGDVEGALELLSDDASWWLPGKRELFPVAGWYTKGEIAKLFFRMTSRLKHGLAMTVKSVIAEGDLVSLEVESHGELDNGRLYNNEYHTLMRVSHGKIHEVREYNDTLHAHAVWLQP